MRKLLVLLVALVAVAAFAAVSISGSAEAKLEVTFIATPTTVTSNISSSGSVRLVLSGNVGEKTGFSVSFGTNPFSATDSSAYVWEYLYKTDALSVKYRLGTLSRGTTYVRKPARGAFALDFDIALGDLKDNLSVFVYPTGSATMLVDLDVWNKLNFTFVTLTAFASGVLSAGAGSFPLLGLDATIDLAKALNIQGATLSGYTYLKIDPNASGLNMLPKYRFGVDFGIDTLNGGVWFGGPSPDKIGASVETTVLAPVKIGGSVELPVNLSDFSDVELKAFATWKSELLTHTISLSFNQPRATVAWRVSVSF
jgi:archaellin